MTRLPVFLLVLPIVLLGCPGRGIRSGQVGFLKGQLHLHTNNSGDSDTPPAQVIRWYEAHGYDFIVFTDHEQVTAVPSTASMLVIPGVELTQNLDQCEPPPPSGLRCLLHINALFVTPPPGGAVPWRPAVGSDRIGRYRRALAVTTAMGGIAQLNHPNYEYSADAQLVAALARDGLTLLEIANEASDSNNDPQDGRHPSTEAIWDAALTAGATVFGTATDDAHHHDEGDRGFVMVRAAKEPGAIRAALVRGDFYASTGVLLKRVDRTATALEIEVADRSLGAHRFVLIGTGGRELARAEGRRVSFRFTDDAGGYTRAVVVDGQGRKAWVQPARSSSAAR